ncbi:MAG: FAD binding domain-containing protein [Acidimicrobiales bacterium]|jgi:NADPH-dependent glutamate synthase beta subunit-like oxidoreductase
MTLPPFDHVAVDTLEEAAGLIVGQNARVIAGGTDLLGSLKDRVHRDPPRLLIDIKHGVGANHVTLGEAGIRIGALTTLSEIADHELVKSRLPLLAQAARAVGSPQIRNMATVAGNICQEPRCWYYRAPDNAFHCFRKGGTQCAALLGDNRFHSIFGAGRASAPPCTDNCPAHIDIPAYLELIRAGDWQAAAHLVLQHNPMPAITGRVCPHFCEMGCNRSQLDEAVSTRAIERRLGDMVLAEIPAFFKPPHHLTAKRVAVVGSGPAGLAAAYYLRKAGHGVTVFDAMGEAGGMLTYSIPDYRLPRVVVQEQIAALRHMGIEFVTRANIQKDTLVELQSDFDSTFLATGAWQDKTLSVAGGEYLESGLEFLIGVRTSRQSPGEQVLVIGGGGVAIDVAISARRLGAKRVTIACLESREAMPAASEEIGQALEEGVGLLTSWGPRRVLTTRGKLSGMEFVRCTSVFDAAGRFSPSFDADTKLSIDADSVLLAIGQVPDLRFAQGSLRTDGTYIVVTEPGITSLPGVFAGGDVVTGPASVIGAIAAGRDAAVAINSYLGGPDAVLDDGDKGRPSSLIPLRAEALSVSSRAQMVSVAPSERTIENEDVSALDLASVEAEVDRCLNCACVAVNVSDLAPALVALDARVRTTKRVIDAELFFAVGIASTTVLDSDELVTEIEIPLPPEASIQCYRKFRLRHSIDFAIVSLASVLSLHDNKIQKAAVVLGAVAPVPLRAADVERYLIGREPSTETAEAAGVVAVRTACPAPKNAFKAQIVRALIREAVLEPHCSESGSPSLC